MHAKYPSEKIPHYFYISNEVDDISSIRELLDSHLQSWQVPNILDFGTSWNVALWLSI